MLKSRERIAIRDNGLLKSRERITIRGNEFSNSRERITYPWERITNPWERIAQFDITIYLWLFLKILMSPQGFRTSGLSYFRNRLYSSLNFATFCSARADNLQGLASPWVQLLNGRIINSKLSILKFAEYKRKCLIFVQIHFGIGPFFMISIFWECKIDKYHAQQSWFLKNEPKNVCGVIKGFPILSKILEIV